MAFLAAVRADVATSRMFLIRKPVVLGTAAFTPVLHDLAVHGSDFVLTSQPNEGFVNIRGVDVYQACIDIHGIGVAKCIDAAVDGGSRCSFTGGEGSGVFHVHNADVDSFAAIDNV